MLKTYNYTRVHGGNKIKRRNHEIYRFKNDFGDIYLVEVFFYDYSVYAIKFFLKKHRLSDNRYNMVYPKTFGVKQGRITGNYNFLKVLNTISKIAMDIIGRDPLASFGFLGAPRASELDEGKNAANINSDCTVGNTKRYIVYSNYVARYYNPKDFEYISSPTSSIMLLRNNKNAEVLTKDVAESYIVNEIIPNLSSPEHYY